MDEKTKLDIIKLIIDTSTEINKQTKTDLFLKYNNKERLTDTGYAIDGIIFFQEILLDKIKEL